MLDATHLIVATTEETVAYVKHRLRLLMLASLGVLVLGEVLAMAGLLAFIWRQTHSLPSSGAWLPMAELAAPVPIVAAVLWLHLGLFRMFAGLSLHVARTMVVGAKRQQAIGAPYQARIGLVPSLPSQSTPALPYLGPSYGSAVAAPALRGRAAAVHMPGLVSSPPNGVPGWTPASGYAVAPPVASLAPLWPDTDRQAWSQQQQPPLQPSPWPPYEQPGSMYRHF